MHSGMHHEVKNLCLSKKAVKNIEFTSFKGVFTLLSVVPCRLNAFVLHYGSMTSVLGSFEINDLCLQQKIAFTYIFSIYTCTTTLKLHFGPCNGDLLKEAKLRFILVSVLIEHHLLVETLQ